MMEKLNLIEVELKKSLCNGSEASPFIESLHEMNRTFFGKKLIKETPLFSVVLSSKVYHPHILSNRENIIYYPKVYDFQDRTALLFSFSHEMQHLVQRKNGLLLTMHRQKASLEDFFIQEKLTEAQAETTSSLILSELANLNGSNPLKQAIQEVGRENYYKKQGAQIIKQMMQDDSHNEWQDAYNMAAVSHVALLAMTHPEKIIKESKKAFHQAVLKKYADQYAPFLKSKEIDIIHPEQKEQIKELKKIITKRNPFLMRQFLYQMTHQ